MYRLLALALLLSSAAHAQGDLPVKADLATLNCRSIFEMKRTNTVMVLAWLQGRYAARSAAPILDSEELNRDAGALSKYCDENPSKTVIEAADHFFSAKR